MMNKPLVSVVMPVYNAERFLVEAIESILGQSYQHFEFIMVNDGSNDGSLSIMTQYAKKDKRIQIISQENKGISDALNQGIKKSQGQYIARMDADDISLKERLMVQISFLEQNPHIDVLGCDCFLINANGDIKKKIELTRSIQDIAITLCVHVPFTHSSVVIRRRIFDHFAYEDEPCEDYLLFAQCFSQGNFANIPQALLKYRHNYGHSLTDTKRYKMRVHNKIVGRYFFNKHQTYLKQLIGSKFTSILVLMFVRGYFKFSLSYLLRTPKYWLIFPLLVLRYWIVRLSDHIKYKRYSLAKMKNEK